jgi:hypothetical protein
MIHVQSLKKIIDSLFISEINKYNTLKTFSYISSMTQIHIFTLSFRQLIIHILKRMFGLLTLIGLHLFECKVL